MKHTYVNIVSKCISVDVRDIKYLLWVQYKHCGLILYLGCLKDGNLNSIMSTLDWSLEEEALNRHIWRTRCGRGYRPVATQTTHVKSFSIRCFHLLTISIRERDFCYLNWNYVDVLLYYKPNYMLTTVTAGLTMCVTCVSLWSAVLTLCNSNYYRESQQSGPN